MSIFSAVMIALILGVVYVFVVWKPMFHDTKRDNRLDEAHQQVVLNAELSDRLEKLRSDLAAGKLTPEEYETSATETKEYYNNLYR